MLTGLLDGSRRKHRQLRGDIDSIRTRLTQLETLNDADLDRQIAQAHQGGADGQDITVSHLRIALATEAVRRTLGLRLHDNQIQGALALTDRQVVELATGEGKTVMLVPFVFDAVCSGRSVHVATANTYLAERDASWMAPAYSRLGVSVASTSSQSAREALAADVCYSTVDTLATLWLRDQKVTAPSERLWRQADVCVVDEADAVLLDLVRSSISISRTIPADPESAQRHKELADLLVQADENGEGGDWGVDEAKGVAALLESGIDKIEAALGVELYDGRNSQTVAGITDALVARALMQEGRDYLVEDGRIRPIDRVTGRVGSGRYTSGLMSALEVKEQVEVTDDVEILAQVAAGAFLGRYSHLCGMTATAVSARDELVDLYGLDTFAIAPHLPLRRQDHEDVILRTAAAKFDALVADAAARHRRGQPVLIGVESGDDLEQVARRLEQAGIDARYLSARNHAEEAEVLSLAGRYGAVTVATRMAGRGVDIVLGGGDPSEADRVREQGGLCVLGAQRFDSRRGDDQLRGRAGRQGDVGESRFYVSLEDDLVRIYAGEALAATIDRLNRLQGDTLGHRQMTRLVDKAQAAKSAANHALRKNLLAYDTVLAGQRDRFYQARELLVDAADMASFEDVLADLLPSNPPTDYSWEDGSGKGGFSVEDEGSVDAPGAAASGSADGLPSGGQLGGEPDETLEERRLRTLTVLDDAWRDHLAACRQLREGIGLRSLGQRNPLIEYQRESAQLLHEHLKDAAAQLLRT